MLFDKMHRDHDEGSQETEGSRFLPIDDNKELIVEQRLRSRSRSCPLSWVLTVIFGTLLILQNVYYLLQESSCRLGPVYDTDFEPMRQAISSVKIRFTSPLYIDDNGTFHRYEDPGAIKYIGGPEEELDANWESLLGGRYFRLTEQETNTLNEDSELPPLSPLKRNGEDYFFAGIDMLHSLHCLNALRKHLDPGFSDHVAMIAPEMRQLHLDHCVEQLRQSIMCHGDATPVTLKPILQNSSTPALLGETERLHTCRDASRLREATTKEGQLRGTSETIVG